MTHHEMLAVLASAQVEHAKPVNQGGHGGPLTTACLFASLPDNAHELGYPAGFLRAHFRRGMPTFEKKGWLLVEAKCGQEILTLTQSGRDQLAEWNHDGCESHDRRQGRSSASYRRSCIGRTVRVRALRNPRAA
jgi:hypothetical protein